MPSIPNFTYPEVKEKKVSMTVLIEKKNVILWKFLVRNIIPKK